MNLDVLTSSLLLSITFYGIPVATLSLERLAGLFKLLNPSDLNIFYLVWGLSENWWCFWTWPGVGWLIKFEGGDIYSLKLLVNSLSLIIWFWWD